MIICNAKSESPCESCWHTCVHLLEEPSGKGVCAALHSVSFREVGFARGWFKNRPWIRAWKAFPKRKESSPCGPPQTAKLMHRMNSQPAASTSSSVDPASWSLLLSSPRSLAVASGWSPKPGLDKKYNCAKNKSTISQLQLPNALLRKINSLSFKSSF